MPDSFRWRWPRDLAGAEYPLSVGFLREIAGELVESS
jgi:hypothetical protein